MATGTAVLGPCRQCKHLPSSSTNFVMTTLHRATCACLMPAMLVNPRIWHVDSHVAVVCLQREELWSPVVPQAPTLLLTLLRSWGG